MYMCVYIHIYTEIPICMYVYVSATQIRAMLHTHARVYDNSKVLAILVIVRKGGGYGWKP